MADDARRNERALAELLTADANRRCADCGRPGTRWASWNIGVFLCTRCGGVHRSLGTHISRVKSVNLDRWTDEQVARMAEVGNERANAAYNPHPERHPFPTAAADIEQYIRDKYERRLFSGGAARPLSSAGAPSIRTAPPAASAPAARPAAFSSSAYPGAARQEPAYQSTAYRDAYSTSSYAPSASRPVVRTAAQSRYLAQQAQRTTHREHYSAEMRALIEMGFTDIPANAAALADTHGDVQAAVGILVANRRSSPVLPADAYSPRSDSSVRDSLHDVFSSPPPPSPVALVDPFAAFEELSPRQPEPPGTKCDDADLDALCRPPRSPSAVDAHNELAAVFGGLSTKSSTKQSASLGHVPPADGPLIEDFAEFATAPPPPAVTRSTTETAAPSWTPPRSFDASGGGVSLPPVAATPSTWNASYQTPTASDPWSHDEPTAAAVKSPPQDTWTAATTNGWSAAAAWQPPLAESRKDDPPPNAPETFNDDDVRPAADYSAFPSHGLGPLASNPWATHGDSSTS